jgi:hypothetical protein
LPANASAHSMRALHPPSGSYLCHSLPRGGASPPGALLGPPCRALHSTASSPSCRALPTTPPGRRGDSSQLTGHGRRACHQASLGFASDPPIIAPRRRSLCTATESDQRPARERSRPADLENYVFHAIGHISGSRPERNILICHTLKYFTRTAQRAGPQRHWPGQTEVGSRIGI